MSPATPGIQDVTAVVSDDANAQFDGPPVGGD